MSQAPVHETPVHAPEIKASHDTIGAAFEDFMGAFEAFKDTNDRRLREVESKLTEDVVTRDKMERINRAMDDQKRALDQLMLKKARPAIGGREAVGDVEHKAAFEAYVRHGDETGLREVESKSFSVGKDGGFLVPAQMDTEIGRMLTAISPIRSLATVRQVSGSVLKKPVAANGLKANWVGETDKRPETDTPNFVELSFPTMELYAMPAATVALLDDAAVDIESWIASEVDIAFAQQEGTAFVSGDGKNKPKGFLAEPQVADSGWAWGSLGTIASGAATGFKAADPSDVLVDLIYSLKAGYRQNARFVMNRRTQGEIRKFKDRDGNYLWQPPAAAGQAASLLGFGVVEAEDMPSIGQGTVPLAFGDFRAGYLVVDRTGVRILRDPYSNKPYVQFYVTKRVGGGVQNYEAIKLLKMAA